MHRNFTYFPFEGKLVILWVITSGPINFKYWIRCGRLVSYYTGSSLCLFCYHASWESVPRCYKCVRIESPFEHQLPTTLSGNKFVLIPGYQLTYYWWENRHNEGSLGCCVGWNLCVCFGHVTTKHVLVWYEFTVPDLDMWKEWWEGTRFVESATRRGISHVPVRKVRGWLCFLC